MSIEEDLRSLVDELYRERGEKATLPPSCDELELFDVYRALVNVRPPAPLAPKAAAAQDRVLQALIARAGVTRASDIAPCPADSRIAVWRGDITTLAADAIVNAANEQGLGCWVPEHFCIDNAIHTYAGTQLRLACAQKLTALEAKGFPGTLRPGSAMVTKGFNLPASHVIHTVGPVIAGGHPTSRDEATLASCYESCLEAASDEGLHSIAFCCISTGVFGYPQKAAARVAVSTVRQWLDAHRDAGVKVIFDVFSDADLRLYLTLLDRV